MYLNLVSENKVIKVGPIAETTIPIYARQQHEKPPGMTGWSPPKESESYPRAPGSERERKPWTPLEDGGPLHREVRPFYQPSSPAPVPGHDWLASRINTLEDLHIDEGRNSVGNLNLNDHANAFRNTG